MAVKGIHLAGNLVLPERCGLHVINGRKNVSITEDIAELLTGLTVCHGSPWFTEWVQQARDYYWSSLFFYNLKQLRITLTKRETLAGTTGGVEACS